MKKPNLARFTNNFIIESVEFLLKNNCTFKDQLFNQINGTAIVTSFTSVYACLTIGYLEETVLFPKLSNIYAEHNVLTVKETYKRFMDDGIVFLPRYSTRWIMQSNSRWKIPKQHHSTPETLEESISSISVSY